MTAVPPTRVPGGRLAPGLALGLFVICLALVVGVAIVGREGPAHPASSRAAAAGVTTAAPAQMRMLPTPGPAALPAVPRGGIPAVTVGPTHLLAESQALGAIGHGAPLPDSGYWRAVADGEGIVWAIGTGQLLRYDPSSGTGRSWTIADDTRFDVRDITPAHAGGVWLIGARTLRRFDGSRFDAALDVGGDLTAGVEAPDGSLWAATSDGAVVHPTGASQIRIDALRPDADAAITAIAVDATGELWCGWRQGAGTGLGWVSWYDGIVWRVAGAADAAPLGGAVRSLTPLPDGSVWALTEAGLARFNGSAWSDLSARGPLRNLVPDAAGAAPDGSLWVAAGGGLVRFARGAWTSYGSIGGLPAGGGPTWLVVTARGIFAAPEAGIYRLTDGHWQRVRPIKLRPGPAGALPVGATSGDDGQVSDGVWRCRQQVAGSRQVFGA